MKRRWWLLALCLGLALVPRISGADDDEHRGNVRVAWYKIAGGGGISRGDNLVVQGTTGQTDAGVCTVAPITLVGGFWTPQASCCGDEDLLVSTLAENAGLGLVRAEAVDGGIEIRLERAALAELTEIVLERGASAEGPWNRVPFERRDGGSGRLIVRPVAAGDQTWYYRAQVTEPGIQMKTFGPIMIPADAPIREFSLSRLAPNPSHGVTQIVWSVPRESRLRLTIHDVQGRRVATLADGAYPAGRHDVKWNPLTERGDVAPGIYFVRLQSPDGVFVRRLVLAY